MTLVSWILLVAVAVLVMVIVAQHRRRVTLIAELEAARAREVDLAAGHTRQLEEARSQVTSAREGAEAKAHEAADGLRVELEEATARASALQARADEATRALQTELQQERSRAIDLETKLEEAQRRVQDAANELEATRSRAEKWQADQGAASKQGDEVRRELDKERAQVRRYRDELEQARQTARGLEADLLTARNDAQRHRGEAEQTRVGTDERLGQARAEVESYREQAARLQQKADELSRQLTTIRADSDARMRDLTLAIRHAESEVATAQMQKEAFAAEVKALRDEMERRKKLAEGAEGKTPSVVQKAKPSKPPEPVQTYFCLVCGEGGSGPKPHRCMVEELEQQKKLLQKR